MKSAVYIKSFGCQMNKLDTALVVSALQEAGLSLTDSIKEADVVLINTCSVRQHAEQRVFSHLGHLKHLKEHRPELVVAVMGCMAQRLGDELLEHEAVNIVCGPAQIPQIAHLIRDAMARACRGEVQNDKKNLPKQIAVTERIRQPVTAGAAGLDDFELEHSATDAHLPGQAFVRVMRGCNYFCTYCVVPYVRGPEACRAPDAILEQVKRLADEGIKQVTLLGQTVNSYRYRSGAKTWCLADLLDRAARVEGIEWVKFVTSYPADEFYEEILQAMAAPGPKDPTAEAPLRVGAVGRVCRYLHMPAQSGSDRILHTMKRRYTAAHYLELIERAREIVPNIAVAGDFIVGFPGETEEDFQATVELVRRVQYRNCFVFQYSPRPGTVADQRLADTIPAEVKQRRNAELLAVQEQVSGMLNEAFLDRQVVVLVEGPSKKAHINPAAPTRSPAALTRSGTPPTAQQSFGLGGPSGPGAGGNNHAQLVGRTSSDQIVVFHGPPSLAGRFAQIRITRTSPLTLFGELATSSGSGAIAQQPPAAPAL